MTTPLRATLIERAGKAVISLEGTPVATVDTEPKAIGVLCAEALRIGRPLLVEVGRGRSKRHLAIDEQGHATWTAGMVPHQLEDDDAPAAPAVPIARATPSQAHTYAVTSKEPVNSSPPRHRPRTRRGGTFAAAALCVAALAAGGFVSTSGLSKATAIRHQTDVLTSATPVSPAEVAQLRTHVPATATSSDIDRALRAAAGRHGVTVSALAAGQATGQDEMTPAGPVTVTRVPATATLTGATTAVQATLAALETGAPALFVQEVDLSTTSGRTTAHVTVAGYASQPR